VILFVFLLNSSFTRYHLKEHEKLYLITYVLNYFIVESVSIEGMGESSHFSSQVESESFKNCFESRQVESSQANFANFFIFCLFR
jgi:hypothetical protein